MKDLKNILECLIFVSDEPLSLNRIKKILPDVDVKDIRQGLISLIHDYDARDGGFYLREVAGGYQFRSAPDFREYVLRLIQPNPVRLSKAALEALAIVAYRQPVIRSDVEHIRGVDSGGVLRMLLERKLIRILGKKDIPGRPLIYGTTKQFLEIFDLKNLSDLPSLREIEELGAQTAESPDGEPPDADDTPEPGTDSETEPVETPEPGIDSETEPVEAPEPESNADPAQSSPPESEEEAAQAPEKEPPNSA